MPTSCTQLFPPIKYSDGPKAKTIELDVILLLGSQAPNVAKITNMTIAGQPKNSCTIIGMYLPQYAH